MDGKDGASGFRLTNERKIVLDWLLRYRYLRTSHFYELSGVGQRVSDRAVRRLLHDFSGRGFIRRRAVVANLPREPAPRYENVYWLSPAGARLARDCELCGDDLPDPPRPSPRTIAHDVAITDVHFGVDRFCRESRWLLYWQQHALRHGVNPDALFALTDPEKDQDANTTYYFLEVERSWEGGYREGRSVLLRRLYQYAEYGGSTACKEDWAWFSEFRVVIIVATEARRRHLLARLSMELPLPMFWVAVQGQDLAGPVFQSPGEGDRSHSLLD